jgi:hypothetical protein
VVERSLSRTAAGLKVCGLASRPGPGIRRRFGSSGRLHTAPLTANADLKEEQAARLCE